MEHRKDDARPRPRSRWARAGRWLCVGGAALGAVGLLEGLLAPGLWTVLFPGEPFMRLNTALALVLLGGAATLRADEELPRGARAASTVAALVALVVGAATLAEYVLDLDMGIDRLLARGASDPYGERPAAMTALGATLLSAAILLVDVRRRARARPSEWLAIAAWLVGFIALLGYAFRVAVLYRTPRVPELGVAPATAVSLLLTATGLLLERPSAGLMRVATAPGPGGVLLRRLAPLAVVAPALLALAAVHVLRAFGLESATLLGAVVAASTTVSGLLLLVVTAAPLNRVHEALEVSRARSRDLVEHAPDGIFLADLDGRYTDVNEAGCRMLGFNREELVGKGIVDLVPAERLPQLAAEKERMLRGEGVSSEWALRRRDGSWLPVEISAKILPDGRWQGFVRDVSERKRLEAALRELNADLVRAQSVAQVGSWRLDVRRNVLLWSEEEYRMFGVPQGTPMTYEKFLACNHPDDRARVDREWKAALGGKPYDVEHRIVVEGEVRWVRDKADLEFDERGELLGGIGVTLDVTDRKRREEELRVAQERLDLALRGADLGLWDWNVATGEVVFNARWAEMRGYRLDELRGHVDTWSSGVHPDDWPRVKAVLDELVRSGLERYETEHRVRTKSGAWIWILDRGKVFARNERGEPTRMVGTELDITARKQAEEALRLSEAKAAGILSISADAIVSIDERQRITLFNEGAEKIFGWSKEEVLGAPLEVLIPARLRAGHRKLVEAFAAGPSTSRRMRERDAPIMGLRKSGEEFPADAAISKIAVGGATVLTVALRDVTRQKRHEEEQRFLAEVGSVVGASLDLEATLTSIGRLATRSFSDYCVLWIVEEDGEIRRVKTVCRHPGRDWICEALPRLPLERARVDELWSELEANRPVLVAQVTEERLRSLAQSEAHLRVLREMRPESFIMAPLFAHGRLVGAMSLVSATPGRRYGQEDVRFAVQLAERAGYAVDNARLYAAARRAIESRDVVLGVVAHDLRNPLGTVLTQAAVLRRPGAAAGPRCARAADSIERAGQRMNRIIADLLDVTRLEEGKLSLEPARVDVRQVVGDAVQAQEPLAAAASLRLVVEVAPDVPEVWADRDRLLQIFENLVGNALKFTDAGGTIRVGAAPAGGEVRFWVADTGKGICAEDLPHVFDRFWQAEQRERKRGLGLGLPIVKGLVEAQGGRIWVESEPGRGTTFFFTVPACPPALAWPHADAPGP